VNFDIVRNQRAFLSVPNVRNPFLSTNDLSFSPSQGESYAGLLPAAANTTSLRNSLYFWFFPSSSSNPFASNELVIWLNGGPGCSSLEGLIQENGPFLWQSGTYAPQRNPFSWTNLTNVVYVDQPIGTGFSPAAEGEPESIVDQERVARDFGVFWRNFVGVFGVQGRKIYLTG
jgi:carboxypeptidase D